MSDADNTERSFTQEQLNRVVEDRLARAEKTYEGRHADALKAQRDRADALEQKLAEQEQRIHDALVNSAITAAAIDRNIVDREAATKLIDRTNIVVTDDVVSGVEEAMDGLVYAKPYLVKPPPVGSVDQGARGGVPRFSREALKTMTVDEIIDAQNKGSLDHLLKGGG